VPLQEYLVIHVECVQCNHIFGDDEDEFGICPQCETQQPESGSWAKEELAHISHLESQGMHEEAVADAMEVLHMATDIHYGDWPLSHSLAETIRRNCEAGGLVEQLQRHELLWKRIEAMEMGGDPDKVGRYERTRNPD